MYNKHETYKLKTCEELHGHKRLTILVLRNYTVIWSSFRKLWIDDGDSYLIEKLFGVDKTARWIKWSV